MESSCDSGFKQNLLKANAQVLHAESAVSCCGPYQAFCYGRKSADPAC